MSRSTTPFPTSTAALLVQYGIPANDATSWSQYLPNDPATEVLTRAQAWQKAKMTVTDAIVWDRAGYEPTSAWQWFFLGFTTRGAEFVQTHIPQPDWDDWLFSGMSGRDMVEAVGYGCRTVAAALFLTDEVEQGRLDRGTVRLRASINGVDVRELL